MSSAAQKLDELPPRNPLIHNAAIAGAVLTPVAMLLPPRKMDIRFFILAGAFSLSTNQLAYAYTGQSIYGRVGNRFSGVFGTELPEGAKRTQQLLREHREREAALEQQREQQKQNGDGKGVGLVKDIWMGGEGEDWKQKRAEEHRKAFEEGKGMSDIIFEQISDVWRGNWRKSKKADESTTTSDEPTKK